MAIDFVLPDVGENVEKADIGQVLVKEGDVLTKDQVVLELETEKAVFELPCPHAGKVTKIHVKPGQTVKVGEPLLTVEATASSGSTAAAPPPAPAKTESKTEFKPAPSEPPAPSAPPGVKEPAIASASPIPSRSATDGNGQSEFPAPAGPATRRLARQLGVNLHQVAGSGPGGRVTREDVETHVRDRLQGGPAAVGIGVSAASLPDFAQWGPIDRRPFNKIAKTAAANLAVAWQTIPHVTQHELVDVTQLEAGRRKFVESAKGPKVTMTVLAMKACVAALKAFPHFNASYDPAAGEVILKRYYHLGVAVDTEHGLLVPVVRDVDRKTVLELAVELAEMAEKARSRKLDLAAFKGGTFTISNLGGIGGTAFTPIVNAPEVAILGMSRSRWQPTVVDGKIEPRLLLPLSLSYDHRVINGADGARFVGKLASLLSEPFALLAET